MTRVYVRHSNNPLPRAEDLPGPPLHEVEDRGRLAIFDPKRCDEEACWIQIDSEHAIDPREAA